MKPSPFTLHLPDTLQEVLELLATNANARVIAGGQSLMPMLNLRLVSPDDLIDLSGIKELVGIRLDRGDVVIGAMTPQRDVEFSSLVDESLPLLKEAILNVGHRQTRNRGTIGGSICHLDPSAEQPTIAIAMDAQLTIQSVRGSRVAPMNEFALDLMTTCLQDDEVLTSIRFTPWGASAGYGFVEYGRRHGDFAIASAAVLVELEGDGTIKRSSLTLGGVAAIPFRVTLAEEILQGQQATEELISLACAKASECDALNDPTYPSWYRQRLAEQLLQRAIGVALRRARASRSEERQS